MRNGNENVAMLLSSMSSKPNINFDLFKFSSKPKSDTTIYVL